MASPQKENGYTPIAHEIIEALALCRLPEYERIILDVIFRKTYGWGKPFDWIANSQFVEATGIKSPHISRTVKSLKDKNIITCTGKSIGIQKDYEKWKVTWRGNKNYLYRQKKLPPQAVQKIKDKIYKGEKKFSHNKKDMIGYNENEHHDDLPSIDADSEELIVPLEEKEKQRNKEKNAKKRELVDWLITHQKRDPLRTNRPAQLKALNRLIEMNISPEKIKNTLFECEQSDFWQGKKEKPDFNTVKNIMEKRG